MCLNLTSAQAECCDEREIEKGTSVKRYIKQQPKEIVNLNWSVVLQKHTWQTFMLVTGLSWLLDSEYTFQIQYT